MEAPRQLNCWLAEVGCRPCSVLHCITEIVRIPCVDISQCHISDSRLPVTHSNFHILLATCGTTQHRTQNLAHCMLRLVSVFQRVASFASWSSICCMFFLLGKYVVCVRMFSRSKEHCVFLFVVSICYVFLFRAEIVQMFTFTLFHMSFVVCACCSHIYHVYTCTVF